MAKGAGKAKRGCGCVAGPRRGVKKAPRQQSYDVGGYVQSHPGIPEHPAMHTQVEEWQANRGVPNAFRSQTNPMLPSEQMMHNNMSMPHFTGGGAVRGRR